MWIGSFWYPLVMVAAPSFEVWRAAGIPSVERMWVAGNMGLAFHRYNEFMYLMLGETVLQVRVLQVRVLQVRVLQVRA